MIDAKTEAQSLYRLRHPITTAQRRMLDFFRDFQHDYGFPPTYRDAMKHFGFKSPQAVAEPVGALIRKGFLRRLSTRGVSRGIVATDFENERHVCPMCRRELKSK